MKIYFVRHGRTEWNVEGRFQGYDGDSPLLPQSYDELTELGAYLSDATFDAIYASDSGRALTTAQAIKEVNPANPLVQCTKALREWNFGKLEGTKISLFRDIYPRQYQALLYNPVRFNHDMFGAESVYQATGRLLNFVKNLRDTDAETVLIVSHGTVLTAGIRLLLGYDYGQLRSNGSLDNASVTVLETNDFDHFDLLAWNDTSYKKEPAVLTK